MYGPGGVYKPYVAECLRKVSQLLVGARIYLLGEQAYVVGVRDGVLENLRSVYQLFDFKELHLNQIVNGIPSLWKV